MAANKKSGVSAKLATIIAGCCIKGVIATIKTRSIPYLSKKSSVQIQDLVSFIPGYTSRIHSSPWVSTKAASMIAPSVDPIATLKARVNHRRGVSMELEIKIPSLGMIITMLSRVASIPIKGGYQMRSAYFCKILMYLRILL